MDVTTAAIALGAGFIAAAVFVLSRAALAPRHGVPAARLARVAGRGAEALRTGERVPERVLRPMLDPLVAALIPVAPGVVAERSAVGRIRTRFRTELSAAGDPVPARTFLLIQIVLPVLLGLLLLAASRSVEGLVFAVGVTALSALAPGIWLSGRATRRRDAINRQLPDILDLIVVSAESGLGFEASLARITEHSDGPLPDEFRRALAEMNVGLGRRRALHGLAARTGVPALLSLVSAILQSEQTGMSIAQVLRAQAEHLRVVRRQQAQEAAMKAPLKMLFPLVFLIFPALFVVILGPAILQLLAAMRETQ